MVDDQRSVSGGGGGKDEVGHRAVMGLVENLFCSICDQEEESSLHLTYYCDALVKHRFEVFRLGFQVYAQEDIFSPGPVPTSTSAPIKYSPS